MRCHECGIQNPENFVFCVNCRTQLMEPRRKEINAGYLVCKGCDGYYKLQNGEHPENFYNICDCGGRIQYYESIDEYVNESATNSQAESNDINKNRITNNRIAGLIIIGIAAIELLFASYVA